MDDAASPAAWISQPYLSAETLAAHRAEFSAHPCRTLHLRHALRDEAARSLGNFLRDDALFQTEYGVFTGDGGDATVPPETWELTGDRLRFYRFGVFSGVRPGSRLSGNLITYLKFRSALGEDPFRGFFGKLTGLELGRLTLTVHAMHRGDFLRAHTDDVRQRRIAFVLYLSDDWHDDCGGQLRIVRNDGGLTVVEPAYNSLVVFDVRAHREHLILPVADAAGDRVRLSIGGWYDFPSPP